jgi:hypothetical protein
MPLTVLRAIGRALLACARGLANEIGRDELFLAAGLGLLGYGLTLTPWPYLGYIAPGLVLVWMSLPPRQSFVVSPKKTEERRVA